MTKISDTQAILLSTASQRADGSLLPLPASIAGGTRLAKPLAGLLARGLAQERDTNVADAVHRTDGDLRFGLFITPAGEAAIGIAPSDDTGEPQGTPEPLPAADPVAPAADAVPAAPRSTKTALVLGLLNRAGGATLAELVAATDWLPHTTRAALTGLRKKGHDVQRGKRDGVTCYRVAADAAGAR